MTEYRIDPITWFSDREMNFTPSHFVVTTKEMTGESKQWVVDKLTGRFSVVYETPQNEDATLSAFMLAFPAGFIAFEDPKEAIMYELRWS